LSAWPIEGDPNFLRTQAEYTGSHDQSLSDEEFFDLDIDSYYANGNNACGFIPGAPVVLNNDGLSRDEVTVGADDASSWFGSNQTLVFSLHRATFIDKRKCRQTDAYPDSYQASQLGLSDRIKECTILLQHFVEVIAPSYVSTTYLSAKANLFRMDIFDSDAYFGRQFPFRVKHSSMLRLAVAAVAAKQITRNNDNHVREAMLPIPFTIAAELRSSKHINWHYKAADYYDEAISYLRLCLHRCSWSSSPTSNTSPSTLLEASTSPSTSIIEPPNKRRRQESYSLSVNDEELLSVIAVFSLYESMNGNIGEWKQYVADLIYLYLLVDTD
jgi:hypothetical protein